MQEVRKSCVADNGHSDPEAMLLTQVGRNHCSDVCKQQPP